MPDTLILGQSGQVSQALQNCFRGKATVLDRGQVDLAHPDSLVQILDKLRPQTIFNAAAYTQVDRAEDERELCHTINAKAPAALANWCKKNSATLFHFSTDYVYPGNGNERWTEASPKTPANWYGSTKLEGDLAIEASGCKFIIARVSWVYASIGTNFVRTMLRLGAEREQLKVVDDQIGYPTFASDIADGVYEIWRQSLDPNFQAWGTYNLVGPDVTSWFQFAQEIFRQAGEMKFPLKIKNIEAIHSAEYPTKATRPLNSRMSSEKLNKQFQIELPFWKTSLHTCLEQIYANQFA